MLQSPIISASPLPTTALTTPHNTPPPLSLTTVVGAIHDVGLTDVKSIHNVSIEWG